MHLKTNDIVNFIVYYCNVFSGRSGLMKKTSTLYAQALNITYCHFVCVQRIVRTDTFPCT